MLQEQEEFKTEELLQEETAGEEEKGLEENEDEKLLADKDYPCDKCNMSFFYKALLDKHMKMIHKKRKLENS